ncbi:uncharacterized protein JN550_003858 [Neoarthrinium moseri]|uniref:uncharacterized protein n=1 Tax=Neoarthrinium moseri TaxID=1658444 RepID=UPI001FDBF7EC|nr:uncharacterized protein JN550_003858 [Neoarthrinium moseri]KAI1872984.1 hypothetical protein JN550_003858 [Neoarthrinium moseri]
MATARSTVLSTPKLLEQIMVNLDQTTLITAATRVHSFWHRLIQTSPQIGKTILYPDWRPTLEPRCGFGRNDRLLLQCQHLVTGRQGREHTMNKGEFLESIPLPIYHTLEHDSSSPLKDMQVAHPPITKVRWHLNDRLVAATSQEELVDGPGFPATYTADFYFPDGVRVGQLYNMLSAGNHLCHVMWPEPGNHLRQASRSNTDHWADLEAEEANRDNMLLIRRVPVAVREGQTRDKVNLKVYQKNLVSLKGEYLDFDYVSQYGKAGAMRELIARMRGPELEADQWAA